MKLRNIKSTWVSFVIVSLSLCIISCSESKTTEQEELQTEPETVQNQVVQEAINEFYVTDNSNVSLASIAIHTDEIRLNIGAITLFGELKGEKRKYYNQQNQSVYAVKYKDGSFKLRDKDEELLWKVKIKDEKIELADNEEMQNAFQIRLYEGGKLKLKQEGNELSALRFEENAMSLEVGGKYNLRNFDASLAIGVFLIPTMPDEEKYIISAELLKLHK